MPRNPLALRFVLVLAATFTAGAAHGRPNLTVAKERLNVAVSVSGTSSPLRNTIQTSCEASLSSMGPFRFVGPARASSERTCATGAWDCWKKMVGEQSVQRIITVSTARGGDKVYADVTVIDPEARRRIGSENFVSSSTEKLARAIRSSLSRVLFPDGLSVQRVQLSIELPEGVSSRDAQVHVDGRSLEIAVDDWPMVRGRVSGVVAVELHPGKRQLSLHVHGRSEATRPIDVGRKHGPSEIVLAAAGWKPATRTKSGLTPAQDGAGNRRSALTKLRAEGDYVDAQPWYTKWAYLGASVGLAVVATIGVYALVGGDDEGERQPSAYIDVEPSSSAATQDIDYRNKRR